MKRIKKSPLSIFIRFGFAARMALHGILANPLRSALTILGVAIGVASVVSLMGIGEGARRSVVRQFESLGSNVIDIKANHVSAEFAPDYADELIERVEGLKLATPVVHAKAVIKWRRIRGNVDILGVNELYSDIRDHKLAAGHFFTSLHVKQRSPVAILGYNLGAGLAGGRSLVGSTLTLNGSTYKIIGVLGPKGQGNAEEIDNKIIIPFTAAMKVAEKKTVDEIWGKAASATQVDLALVQLSRIIRTKLGLNQKAPDIKKLIQGENPSEKAGDPQGGQQAGMNPAAAAKMAQAMPAPQPGAEAKPALPEMGEDLVTITNLNTLVKEADNANRVMTLLLGGIAAVSLLVGGLGIMNIMMVSVNERIEEIGVRRALGGKQGDLLLQFLLEALYVSLIGSVAGIAAGIWGLNIFEGLGFETAVSFEAVKIAAVVALASGLLFGVYPAVSASSVPPVEALRRQ